MPGIGQSRQRTGQKIRAIALYFWILYHIRPKRTRRAAVICQIFVGLGKSTKNFVMFFWNINKLHYIHENIVDFVVCSCYNFNQSRSIGVFAPKNPLAPEKTMKKRRRLMQLSGAAYADRKWLRGSPETIIFAVFRQNGGFHGYYNFGSSF